MIDFPLKWAGDIESLNTIASTPSCTGVTGISGTLSCSYQIFSSPVNIARVTVSSLSSSALSGQFSIDISLILTPPFINSIETVSIESMYSDGVVIDTCSSTISNTQPIPFKSMAFSSTNNKTVQSSFTGQLQVVLNKPFYYQDEISIVVPSMFIVNGQISISSTNFAIFTTSVNGQTVTLSNFPSSPNSLATNTIVIFFFQAIKNPDSIEPISISVTFSRQNEHYQSSSTTYTASAATTLSISLQSDNLAVNAIDNTVLSLSDSTIYIPQGSTIKMDYHSSIVASTFSAKSVVSASLGGTLVSGVTYQVQSNVLQINGLFAAGTSAANQLIQIEVDTFVNPPTVKPITYTFSIYSQSGYLIVSGSYSFTAALQSLLSNSVASSSLQVMQSSVTYFVTF